MHEEILKMIEGVDPNDTETLNKIDARVWCWINDYEFVEADSIGLGWIYCGADKINHWQDSIDCNYTRSRDALKAIRPKGWVYTRTFDDFDGYACAMTIPDPFVQFHNGIQHEELAELHCIIQAIAWEKQNA